MKLGSQHNDLDSSPGHSLNGSFRKLASGFLQNELDISPEQSLDGSFRKSNSVISTHSVSGTSVSSKFASSSRRAFKGLKEYAKKLVDLETFKENLEQWVMERSCTDSNSAEQFFSSPFTIEELRKLDIALEGVHFQQLFRMPCSPYVSDDLKEDEYLALEDFLHAITNGLWRAFWHKREQPPFFLSCPRFPGSKFYSIEKAISKGRLRELSGFALMSKLGGDHQLRWHQVVEFALFSHDIVSENELKLSAGIICKAIFYGFHILVSRCLSKTSCVDSSSVFLLVLDSRYGGVVRLGGDLRKLELNSTDPYHSVAEWIKNHAEVRVSPVDRIWNKLGNPNWGDLGTLQLLSATFYSIAQCNGPPRKSIASLALDHSLRLQKRWMECRLVENENALVPFQEAGGYDQGEIVEVDRDDYSVLSKKGSLLKLKQGEILVLDDQQQGQKAFQIQDSLRGGNHYLYSAVSVECPVELLTLYVGAHPSRLEPSWEDMSLWYQVQRQTKVLNILKQQGNGSSNKYLPEIVSSGKVLHSGPCKKQTPGGRCDHPWCGTPILVTSPVGEPLSSIVSRNGPLPSEEAVRCCRDCLAALRSAAKANVLHGDICPENIIRVVDTTNESSLYMPVSWGRAVLEERDSPAINLQFSSSHALQQGKLCPSSDAESLVYLLLFVCGGSMEQQDSMESALQWRERSWAKRAIQQQLGEVSAILKAFADYVDSLCGTPYPIDYDIWLKRLSRAVDGSSSGVGDHNSEIERGKMIEQAGRLSPGTSGGDGGSY